MPAAEGVAHVDVREAHHELGIVDPERAVVDAAALKSQRTAAAAATAIVRKRVMAELARMLRVVLAVACGAVLAQGERRERCGRGGGGSGQAG